MLTGAHGVGGWEAWGQRGEQLPPGFPSPHAVSAGPVNITVQEDEFPGGHLRWLASFAP